MQKLSSMNTSVNTSKLPAVWNKLNWDWVRNHSISNIVDYGCGKRATQNLVRNKLLDEIAVRHCYFPYDPYWGDVDAIRNAISCLTQWKEADLCVCASVLNVIDSVDAIKKIIKEVTQAAYWESSVYEGKKPRRVVGNTTNAPKSIVGFSTSSKSVLITLRATLSQII